MGTRVDFEKLHGAGNDFVFIEDFADELDVPAEEVRRLCDRHFGIGADGVIVVKPPAKQGNAGFMHYINADGSLAQMCGNGVRCFAKYVIDNELADYAPEGIVVETRAGERRITVDFDEHGWVCAATVDMGAPIFDPARVPTILPATATAPDGSPLARRAPISTPYGTFEFTCVSMGNPHAVCFIDDWSALDPGLFAPDGEPSLDTFDIAKVGGWLESCDAFPEKANIEFATVGEDGIAMRVFERGCGETLACGTGACATGVAAYACGIAGTENDLKLKGGTLRICYDPSVGRVMMTGPARTAYTGSVELLVD